MLGTTHLLTVHHFTEDLIPQIHTVKTSYISYLWSLSLTVTSELISSLCYRLPLLNLLTPNDDYSGCTAPLTSKCCILYIYSRNIGTEYFKHGIYCPFFPLQNAVCFIIPTNFVSVLFTFYIQGVLKLKK